MPRTILLSTMLIAALPLAGQAATAQLTRTFTVQKSCDHVGKWYEAHRADVLEASNCRVLTVHADNHYTVQTNTPTGACVYVIRETRHVESTKAGKRITYHIQYVRNVRGRLADQDLTITLIQRKGATEIVMAMTTSVEGKLIPEFAVRSVQGKCLDGSERFITGEL